MKYLIKDHLKINSIINIKPINIMGKSIYKIRKNREYENRRINYFIFFKLNINIIIILKNKSILLLFLISYYYK